MRLGVTLATAAAATWCYLIGESVGAYLGFVQGAVTLFAGCMIGMLLVLLAGGPVSARFGIDSIAASKPQFGAQGWVVPALLQALSAMPNFKLKLDWHLDSMLFGKLIRQFAPDDTYVIQKKGTMLRVDSSLRGVDEHHTGFGVKWCARGLDLHPIHPRPSIPDPRPSILDPRV